MKRIEDYIKNDEIDLEKIIDDFTPYLRTVINNMVLENLSKEDKEEIIADTFFVLWKKSQIKYENEYMIIDAYLAGIARNLTKEKLRKRQITVDIQNFENELGVTEEMFFSADRDEIRQIEKCLKELKKLDIEIFKMFYYSDISIKDIAKKLEISEFNVKTRLYRTRKKIRRQINKGGSYE